MNLPEKHKKLLNLIKQESAFADDDFMDSAITLDIKDIDKLGYTKLELAKSLDRLVKDDKISSYLFNKEPNIYDLDNSHPYYIVSVTLYTILNLTNESKIFFNPKNGEFTYKNKVAKFTENKNPYLLIKILYTNINHIFSYREIIEYFRQQKVGSNKDNLRQYARQVRDRFKLAGIPTNIIYCNNGYSLKEK